MSYKKILLLGAMCALSACSHIPGSSYLPTEAGPRYVPRPNIPVSQYDQINWNEDRSDRKAFNQYEEREQCQHYRRVPRNSVVEPNCAVVRAPDAAMVEHHVVREEHHEEVFHSYTVLFDLNHSDIRTNEMATIDQVAREIETYHPGSVTVTGFADRSGSAKYNAKLSARRAEAVSASLTKHGVPNRVISEQARGENDNAVPTADGVKLQANRRVMIDFHR